MDKSDSFIEYKREYTLLFGCIHFCMLIGFLLTGTSFVMSVASSNSPLHITLTLFIMTFFIGYALLVDMALLRSRYLLSDEGIFAFDGVSNTWVYLKWEDIKSAYYRGVHKSHCLIISTKELTKKAGEKSSF